MFHSTTNGTRARSLAWQILAVICAVNYFAFRTELFAEEFEQNHPQIPGCAGQAAFTLPSLNWETFDKDNASKAFVVDPQIRLLVVGSLPPIVIPAPAEFTTSGPVRDKSPPTS